MAKSKKTKKSRELRLAAYRLPLQTVPPARSKARAQLQWVLDHEWKCTIEEAQQNEEIEIEAVDVVDGSTVLYQLYLWPFGSGVVFAAGTTTVVAEIIQHGMTSTTGDDARAIAAVVKRDGAKLGLRERNVSAGKSAPARASKKEPALSFDEALAQADAQIAAGKDPLETTVRKLFLPWTSSLCGADWRPYPKRLLAELTGEQRTFIERVAAWDAYTNQYQDLISMGLFAEKAHLRRYLGIAPPGPCDTTITVAKRDVPVWWALTAAASGHAKPAGVLAALAALDADVRRSIALEVARGDAYEIVRAQSTSSKHESRWCSPPQIAYTTALFQMLADVIVSLGPAARATAEELLVDLPEYKFGGVVEPHPRTPRVVVALLVLSRVAAPLDESLDARIPDIDVYKIRDSICIDKRMHAKILAAVPAARRATVDEARASIMKQLHPMVRFKP
jgi:hypothetical protein